MKGNGDEMSEFLSRWQADVLPGIEGSAMTLALLGRKIDAKLCLEIGAVVLLEKPLLLVAIDGAYIPPVLRKLATEIVAVKDPMDEADKEAIQAAISRAVAERKMN